MAVTLVEAAKLSQPHLQLGIVRTFIQVSSVLDRMPLEQIEGNAYAYNEELTLPGIEFRAVNAAYAESTGAVVQRTETLAILGGDADVDTFIVATRSNLQDQRAAHTAMKVSSASHKFQDTFINGDVAVDANSFDGLKKRLTGAQVIPAATNGIGPVAGAHDFFDALDSLIAAVPGVEEGNAALYMNASVRAKVRSSARRLGGWSWASGMEPGTGKPLQTYNGIPLLDIGNTASGTLIIPQTETQGTSTVASSIYLVRFGGSPEEGGITGLTNGGVSARDLGEIDSKPVYRTRIEFFCGMGLFSGKAAARLTGVLAA